MNQNKYLRDLQDIKDIMSRSSRFISLSGLSGIFAGLFALGGAYAAYQTVYSGQDYLNHRYAVITRESLMTLLIIALVTLALSIGAGIFFTSRETRKQNEKVWDHQTRRLLINLAIPLVTGGIVCLILLLKGFVGIIAPLTLIFYGLALVNASKYTLNEVRSLGIIEIVLGLISLQFIGYGLLVWAIGFGVMHIVYGTMMQLKYKS
tara:strand:- start:1770 stop:2387 length:618 start_codon:yes stop_codon:yes gene_type:complete